MTRLDSDWELTTTGWRLIVEELLITCYLVITSRPMLIVAGLLLFDLLAPDADIWSMALGAIVAMAMTNAHARWYR